MEISFSYLRKCTKIICNLIIWIIHSRSSLTPFPWRSTRHPTDNKTSQNISLFRGQPKFFYCLSAWPPQLGSFLPISLIAPSFRIPSPLPRTSIFLSIFWYCQIKKDCDKAVFQNTWLAPGTQYLCSLFMPKSKEVNINSKSLHTIGRPKLYTVLSITLTLPIYRKQTAHN